MAKKVKLSNGETLEIKSLSWKQAKQIKLVSMLSKYQTEEGELTNIDEEDMDKVISLVVPEDKQDDLTINDAIAIFSAVIEETFTAKKQK